MRVLSVRLRSTLGLGLGALFALAPAAPAQQLVPVVGAPVAYEVSIPADWEARTEGETLVAGNEEVVLMITTVNLLAGEDGARLSAAELRSRRDRIESLADSDSLLLELATRRLVSDAEYEVSDIAKEIRTLGGTRAAYVRGRLVSDDAAGWFQEHVAVSDGILYIFIFMVQGDALDAHAPLFARIHESFVLPRARR